jgi:hypothetical protein
MEISKGFRLKNKIEMNVQEMNEWEIFKKLIGNTEAVNNPPNE